MPRATDIQTNFTAGEFSPRLYGRVDIQKYHNALESILNMILMPHGGARKREGTYYVAKTKNNGVARFRKFQASVSDNFVLEFGDSYVRFFKNRAPVTIVKNVSNAADNGGGLIRITATAHGFLTGWQVTMADVGGVPNATGFWTITRIDADNFDLVGSTFAGAYTSGGTAEGIYEVATPWDDEEIFQLGFTQSVDVLYICHRDHPVRKLLHSSATDWALQTIEFENGPYLPENQTDITMTIGGTTPGSSVSLVASDDFFQAGHVGAIFRIRDATGGLAQGPWATGTAYSTSQQVKNEEKAYIATTTATSGNAGPIHSGKDQIVSDQGSTGAGVLWRYLHDGAGYVLITAVADAQNATCTIMGDNYIPSNVASSGTLYWSEGAWSDVRGYPGVVSIFEERLSFGRSNYQPQTTWHSVSGDYENFTPSSGIGVVRDDDALTFTIADDRQNDILWFSAGSELQIGTSGGEFVMRASVQGEALTPKNVTVRRHTTHGSAEYVEPVRTGPAVLFLQRSLRKLREMIFDFNTDGYVAPDLTILSEHITSSGIRQIDMQEEPDGVIYGPRNDGIMLGMTYNKEQDVISWVPHRIGGTYNRGKAVVENVCTIQAPDLSIDDLWLMVKRTIGGQTVRYIEYVNDPFKPTENVNGQESAYFVDAGLSHLPDEPAATLTPGDTSGTGVSFTSSPGVFSGGDVDKIIRLNGGKAKITAYVSAGEVTCDIQRALRTDESAEEGYWSMGAAVSSVTGLDHLEGETVRILADGSVRDEQEVVDGEVTISGPPASIVHVGLGYMARFRTLRVEAGAITGTAQGQQKRIDSVLALFYETLGVKAGSNAQNALEVPFRVAADPMTDYVPLFSGYKKLEYNTGWDDAGQVYGESDKPLPMTLLAIVIRLVTNA